jgi:hypothetical protein
MARLNRALSLQKTAPSPQTQAILPEKLLFRVGDVTVQPPPLMEKPRLGWSKWPTRPLCRIRTPQRPRPTDQIQIRVHPPHLLN